MGPEGTPACSRCAEPVGARLARGGLLDGLDERGAMLHPEGARGEARVVAQVRPSDGPAQPLEQLVVVRADVEVPVRRPHGLIRRGEPMRGAERPGRLAGHPVLRGLPHGERHRGLEQRGVDELPEARALAVLERAQDPVGREEPGAEVGQRHAGLRGRVLVPRHADDPAHALGDQVIAAARRVRARAAEAAHRAVDEPRIHRRERLVARGPAAPPRPAGSSGRRRPPSSRGA